MTLNFTNITTPVKLVQFVNDGVNGYLGIGIVTSLATILFLGFKSRGYDTPESVVATMFATMIVSVLLLPLKLISESVLVIVFSLLVASFLWVSIVKK